MSNYDASRRNFLKATALAGIGIPMLAANDASAKTKSVTTAGGVKLIPNIGTTRPRPKGQKPVNELTTAPKDKIRVACVGCGGRGSSLMHDVMNVEFAEIVAVCDIIPVRAENLAKAAEKKYGQKPKVFAGSETIFEKLCELDNIDVVYVATSWEWHVPVAVKAMKCGKHAFVEVAASVTVDEAWKLVDTSEQTQRHCLILENCCYGENELFVLNMAREGVFGELTHGECSYIHDLRSLLFSLEGEGAWRRNFHRLYNGNLYPTHGLGPVAQYMGVGRGDQFKFLVSVSSPEKGLTKWRKDHNPNGGKQNGEIYVCGDMNTSIIKTELGRTIMLQHDVISPRPYSRINALSGTGATFFDYPARMAVNSPKDYGLASTGSHEWLSDEDMKIMREKFTHPMWRKLQDRAAGAGHGGMDFVENYRHLYCLKNGLPLDITVYDAAAWSCLIEISSYSVETGSMPVEIPDFTRGLWKTMKPLPVVTV